MISPRLAFLPCIACFLSIFGIVRGADNIDVVLSKIAPEVMNRLSSSGMKTIGIVPFRVEMPGGKVSTSGALIQTNIAARLERALVYFRDPEAPVDVVFDMLGQARKQDSNAECLTIDGRSKLFQHEYELPVGGKAKVDTFISGLIKISSDWKKTTLFLELCRSKQSERVIRSGPYEIKTDRTMLVQMGKGFSISRQSNAARGMNATNDSIMEGVVADDEWQIQFDKKEGIHSSSERFGREIKSDPWEDLPIALTILYDDRPQPLLYDEYAGRQNFTLKDPKTGQRVTFQVNNKSDEVLGLVLAINGKNLLYGESVADPDTASKFVLKPKMNHLVKGEYDRDLKNVKTIVGLSDSDTAIQALKMPTDAVGLIQLFVYRKGSPHGKDKTSPSPSEQLALPSPRGNSKVVAKGSFNPTPVNTNSSSWNELKSRIGDSVFDEANTSRGLIAAGGETETQKVQLQELGEVVQTDAIVIRYFGVASAGLTSPK